MSEWWALGLLAVAFYFWECCTWTPAAAFACFRKPFRLSWAAATGADLVGNESGGFAFSDSLTLSGNIIHASSWPIAVNVDGFCLDTADATTFWTFDAVKGISSYEKQVRVNGAAAFIAPTEALARQLAAHLNELKTMPASKRAAAIRSAMKDSFDADALDSTWSRFQESTRALRVLAALPLVWLAVIVPAGFIVFGPLAAWPYLLGGLFLASLAVTVEFVRVHRVEMPGASDRWLHAVSMTLFPIAAIRACDRISRERVAHFNPAVIVAVFCGATDGDPILRRLGYDLSRNVMRTDIARADFAANSANVEETASNSPDAMSVLVTNCREWFRAEQRAAFARAMKTLKRDLFAEPEKLDVTMTSYCPRCHGQFGDGTECSDCDDVVLTPFAEAGRKRA